MEREEIKRIAVVGAGLMGHGIAQEFAMGGYEVHLNDLSEEILQQAIRNINANLHMLQNMDLVDSRQATPVPERISTGTSLEDAVTDVDLVVEAVCEDLALKRQVFAEFDRLSPAHAILASNTSGYMPSQLAQATRRPQKVLVTHYINPPYLMPLVEVVRGPQTSNDTVEDVCNILSKIGKRPVVLQKEAPGFIVNRLQIALFREAISLVDKGIATPEDIDLVVSNSFGRRLAAAGPFQVWDVGGWDVILPLFSQLAPHIESSTEVPALLRTMVADGDLGVKTGKGFYQWTTESASQLKRKIGKVLAAVEQLSQ